MPHLPMTMRRADAAQVEPQLRSRVENMRITREGPAMSIKAVGIYFIHITG